ncbi:hypothetical protein [Larkinella arboricola]|uniref:hypothetical protein n=1 Tax=Larkinella arboricola TaxID=643671 RepID=UPI001E3840DE|nr:hypothetical protein [Larkinella arboricola]
MTAKLAGALVQPPEVQVAEYTTLPGVVVATGMVLPLPLVLLVADQLMVPPSQPETVRETEAVFCAIGWVTPDFSVREGDGTELLPGSFRQNASKLPPPGRPGLL